jgi:DNA-binding CsgD family transcriptional regulator
MSMISQAPSPGMPRAAEIFHPVIHTTTRPEEKPLEALDGVIALTLFRNVLDALSTPIFIVGEGHQIVFANAAARAMLSQAKHVRQAAKTLQSTRVGPSGQTFARALERALRQGLTPEPKGIGVPLISSEGEPATAYVLPLSTVGLHGAAAKGFATIFIGHRSDRVPMIIEVLRSAFGLTQSEARIAAMIAKGGSPAGISEALGVSINTVRTQLAGAFSKIGVASQAALAAVVNELMPPVGDQSNLP